MVERPPRPPGETTHPVLDWCLHVARDCALGNPGQRACVRRGLGSASQPVERAILRFVVAVVPSLTDTIRRSVQFAVLEVHFIWLDINVRLGSGGTVYSTCKQGGRCATQALKIATIPRGIRYCIAATRHIHCKSYRFPTFRGDLDIQAYRTGGAAAENH